VKSYLAGGHLAEPRGTLRSVVVEDPVGSPARNPTDAELDWLESLLIARRVDPRRVTRVDVHTDRHYRIHTVGRA
jgi:hypothetical protein